jgi:hypothetical protein
MSRLDVEDTISLEREMLHFTKAVEPSSGLEAFEIAEHYKYSVTCLTEEFDGFKDVPSELTRVFLWHVSLHGEEFWRTMHMKYADRAFAEKRKRIAEVSESTRKETEGDETVRE